MVTKLLIGILAGVLATEDPVALRATWLYNGAQRPAWLEVPAPADAAASITLSLMDAYGGELTSPVAVEPGTVDLLTLLPVVTRLRRAAYLQMLVDSEPRGSALVVQPMLSRLVPITEEAINPNGIRYTQVAGWRDEMAPAPHTDDEAAETAELSPERLYSGLRLYADRDVVLVTTLGSIRFAMRPDAAPNTAWNFRTLCAGGFYRGIVFHRIVPMTRNGDPFVIQAGDPTPTGSGGPGYWLPLEPSDLAHEFGVISMARDVDPDSAGSQIFICLSRSGTARLDGHYCAFGYAVSGTDTILAISSVELADVAAGRPADPPVITRATLVPAPPRRPGLGRPDTPVHRPALEADADGRPPRVPR